MAGPIRPAAARFVGSGSQAHLLLTVKSTASLTEIDIETGEILARAVIGNPTDEKPHELALSPDGSRAYVSIYGTADYGNNRPSNKIAIVDLATLVPEPMLDLGLYRGPHGLAVDRDGLLWVTVEESRSVLVIDPDQRTIEQTVWLEVPVHFTAQAPDGATLYFSHKEYPFVSVVDVATRSPRGRIPCPRGAQGIHASADGRTLFITDFCRPLLHRADLRTLKIVETVPLEGVPGWPFPLSDGRTLAVTTYDEAADRGYVEILDADDLSRRRVVEVAAEPFHLHEAGDGRHVFVVLANGDIPKIDAGEARIAESRLKAGGTMPEAIVVIRR